MENKQNVVSDDEGDDINSQANESNVDTDADTNTTGDVNVSNLSEADSETSDIYEQGEEGQQQEGQQGQGQQEENASVSNSGSVSEYDDDDDDDNDDEDDYDENHLQKFDSEAKKNILQVFILKVYLIITKKPNPCRALPETTPEQSLTHFTKHCHF